MSTSIQEQIEIADDRVRRAREQIKIDEDRARLLRVVAERFPDVIMRSMWDNGPPKPVLNDRKHNHLATHVFLRDDRLYPYFTVRDGGADIHVFVCTGLDFGADARAVLTGLSRKALAELVALTLDG